MDDGKKKDLIDDLQAIVAELGWIIAIPTEGEQVAGLIIGLEAFVNEVAAAYYGEDFEAFAHNSMEDALEELPKHTQGKVKKSDGPTFH